ncbi:uncharacterized protein LOC142163395 [Nicotiana tabacum]|uniref:Uncharacterized protein LOC142163395 n=1 Tax=Nicotiana tabacum TaxID=4097 RepID=A0AC58RVP1_TOBAC
MDKRFGAYLESNGIVHQTSCPYNSAQNGVVGRKNRHLLEVAISLIFTMPLPKPCCGDAILAVAYLINRMLFKPLNFQSPLETLKGKNEYIVPLKGILRHRKVTNVIILPLGDLLLAWMLPFENLSPISILPHHLFRGKSSKEEEVILPNFITGPLDDIVTRESEIGENIQGETIGRLDRPDLKTYSRKNRAEEAIMQSTEAEPSSIGELFTFPNDLDEPIALRKGVRSCITKHPLSNFVSYNSLYSSYRAFALSISSVSIPQNWREAFADPKWKQAMILNK